MRIARPDDDLLAVLRVYAQRDSDGTIPNRASDDEERVWAQMMDSPGLSVYLAEIADQAVGTATLLTMPNLTYRGPTAFIEAVVVAISHRRAGVATTMLRRVLADARTAGCHKVQLVSHKRHATDGAHRFYTGLGFQPEAEGFRLYLRGDAESVATTEANGHDLDVHLRGGS